MHAFKYHRASNVNDASSLAKGDARLLAGGQSLVQAMKLRLSSPTDLIDLGTIKDLSGIKASGTEYQSRLAPISANRARQFSSAISQMANMGIAGL